MSPQRSALILIAQMRAFGISAPAQQEVLLFVHQRPGTGTDEIMNGLSMSKDKITGIARSLREKGAIVQTRPDYGQVRCSSIKLTELARKALEIGGQS